MRRVTHPSARARRPRSLPLRQPEVRAVLELQRELHHLLGAHVGAGAHPGGHLQGNLPPGCSAWGTGWKEARPDNLLGAGSPPHDSRRRAGRTSSWKRPTMDASTARASTMARLWPMQSRGPACRGWVANASSGCGEAGRPREIISQAPGLPVSPGGGSLTVAEGQVRLAGQAAVAQPGGAGRAARRRLPLRLPALGPELLGPLPVVL